jgi:hypothetical protein
MKLACKICGAVLTTELAPLADFSRLSNADGEPRIPKGFFHIAEPNSGFERGGSIVVNLDDLTGANRAKDGRPYNGCCGVDGCDGLNLVCSAGHDVATERSDCWMPHSAVFESEMVVLKE